MFCSEAMLDLRAYNANEFFNYLGRFTDKFINLNPLNDDFANEVLHI